MTDAPVPGLLVREAPWSAVARAIEAGAVAVLPVGAAAKEHGHHMPCGTDWLQAEWLAGALVAVEPVVVWPTLGYGYYPVFVDYPGSITLTERTFEAVVREVLAGIRHAGARTIAVLNTGISTIAPLRRVLAGAGRPAPALVNVYAGPRFTATERAVTRQPWGGHADQIETALMLAIAPDRVDMARAQPNPGRIVRGRFQRSDPGAANYTPSGVNGDPRPATRAQGERLCAAMLADVRDAVRRLRAGDRGG